MMPDLGDYAAEVLLAYGVSGALLLAIVVLTILRSRHARRRLAELEARRNG